MGISLRSALEFAAPLLAIYIFVLGVPLPTSVLPSLSSLTHLSTSNTTNQPSTRITSETLDWASTALAYPPIHSTSPADHTCQNHTYTAQIYSHSPLVIYITSFLSASERSTLLSLAEPAYVPSTIYTDPISNNNENHSTYAPSIRLSSKALLPRTSPAVTCIEDRARAFQGHRPDVFIERLYAQRYSKGGHYAHHYDWASATGTGGRVSSFMVWLDDGCVGGGTNFPRLKRHGGREWCDVVDCDDGGVHQGTTFKPIAGNGVYWENFREDGTGYQESLHAGLPVHQGSKVGLNIWSWWQPGLEKALRERRADYCTEQPP